MESSFLTIVLIILTMFSHTLVSGDDIVSNNVNDNTTNTTIANTTQNIISNEVNDSSKDDLIDVKERFGFQTTTTYYKEEGYTSHEEPYEEEISLIKSFEKTFLDNNYDLKLIEIGELLMGTEAYIRFNDNSYIRISFKFGTVIDARAYREEKIIDMARIILTIPELEFPKEDIDKFIDNRQYFNGIWTGDISQPTNTLYRAYDFHLTNKY